MSANGRRNHFPTKQQYADQQAAQSVPEFTINADRLGCAVVQGPDSAPAVALMLYSPSTVSQVTLTYEGVAQVIERLQAILSAHDAESITTLLSSARDDSERPSGLILPGDETNV